MEGRGRGGGGILAEEAILTFEVCGARQKRAVSANENRLCSDRWINTVAPKEGARGNSLYHSEHTAYMRWPLSGFLLSMRRRLSSTRFRTASFHIHIGWCVFWSHSPLKKDGDTINDSLLFNNILRKIPIFNYYLACFLKVIKGKTVSSYCDWLNQKERETKMYHSNKKWKGSA